MSFHPGSELDARVERWARSNLADEIARERYGTGVYHVSRIATGERFFAVGDTRDERRVARRLRALGEEARRVATELVGDEVRLADRFGLTHQQVADAIDAYGFELESEGQRPRYREHGPQFRAALETWLTEKVPGGRGRLDFTREHDPLPVREESLASWRKRVWMSSPGYHLLVHREKRSPPDDAFWERLARAELDFAEAQGLVEGAVYHLVAVYLNALRPLPWHRMYRVVTWPDPTNAQLRAFDAVVGGLWPEYPSARRQETYGAETEPGRRYRISSFHIGREALALMEDDLRTRFPALEHWQVQDDLLVARERWALIDTCDRALSAGPAKLTAE